MGSRRNTRRVTGARPGGFILIQRCTTHDRLRFRGPQHHAPQRGTRRVPALRFRGIMKPFSALSSKLKIIRATASAHSSTSSALPSVATKIDQYPYASLRLRSNVVIGNTRAGRVPPPPQPVSPGYSRSTLRVSRDQPICGGPTWQQPDRDSHPVTPGHLSPEDPVAACGRVHGLKGRPTLVGAAAFRDYLKDVGQH